MRRGGRKEGRKEEGKGGEKGRNDGRKREWKWTNMRSEEIVEDGM